VKEEGRRRVKATGGGGYSFFVIPAKAGIHRADDDVSKTILERRDVGR
jgi:hypothetical protein